MVTGTLATVKTAGNVLDAVSIIRSILSSPCGLAFTGGVIVGAVAYYAVDKYGLNKDEEDEKDDDTEAVSA